MSKLPLYSNPIFSLSSLSLSPQISLSIKGFSYLSSISFLSHVRHRRRERQRWTLRGHKLRDDKLECENRGEHWISGLPLSDVGKPSVTRLRERWISALAIFFSPGFVGFFCRWAVVVWRRQHSRFGGVAKMAASLRLLLMTDCCWHLFSTGTVLRSATAPSVGGQSDSAMMAGGIWSCFWFGI